MTTEQILIRMGVDAKAVVVGLNQTSSYIKGWATSIRASLGSTFSKSIIGLFAVDKAIGFLDGIKNKIIEIKIASQQTGLGTNFIQGIFNKITLSGGDYKKAVAPLGSLNELVGKLRTGSIDAKISLSNLADVSRLTNFQSYTTEQLIRDLAIQYKKLNSEAERNAMLQRLGIQGWRDLIPVLNMTNSELENLSRNSFFTKFTPETIRDSSNAWGGFKTAMAGIGVAIGNIAGHGAMEPLRKLWDSFVLLGNLHPLEALKQLNSVLFQGLGYNESEIILKEKAARMQKEKASAEWQSIQDKQKELEVIQQQNELLLRQKELTADIADRNKTSIQEMADHARKFLGIIDPKRLNFTVSQRDRMALNIDQKEKQAQVAFERGDDRTFRRLTSEALQLRHGFSAASFKDREPMLKTEIELQKVNLQLAPVARMAEFVNQEHKTPK